MQTHIHIDIHIINSKIIIEKKEYIYNRLFLLRQKNIRK